jgi:hypothetical protein
MGKDHKLVKEFNYSVKKIKSNELFFASSGAEETHNLQEMFRENKIKEIAAGIFTSNFSETGSEIIKRNILKIIGCMYPESVLSHRSAFEFKPTPDNEIFVTYLDSKKIELPGVTINFIKGKGPIEGDNKFVDGLYVSSEARRYLENLQLSSPAALGYSRIEEKLSKIYKLKGKENLILLRDSAEKISGILDMKEEFDSLNKIIEGLFIEEHHFA